MLCLVASNYITMNIQCFEEISFDQMENFGSSVFLKTVLSTLISY